MHGEREREGNSLLNSLSRELSNQLSSNSDQKAYHFCGGLYVTKVQILRKGLLDK